MAKIVETLKSLALTSLVKNKHAAVLLNHGKTVSYGINSSQLCLHHGTMGKHAEHSVLSPLLENMYCSL